MDKRIIILLFFTGAFLFVVALWLYFFSTDHNKWEVVSLPESGVSINLPSRVKPKVKKISVGSAEVKSTTYESKSGGKNFIFGEIEYSYNLEIGKPKYNLIAALNALYRSYNGKLIYSRFNIYEGKQTLDYLIRKYDGQYILGRALVDGKYMYVMNLHTSDNRDVDFNKLAESLTFNKKG